MTPNRNDFLGTATYSPDDNKLRLYPFHRLSTEDYASVKAAGFSWAPKQELFVAPMWTPGREDLLTEVCGEVGDEDASLTDRAEERAERFEDYGEKRAADAETARQAVERIADGIPLGQPILVGHHSERHARKDAERIENGMRKAVRMWQTSEYWSSRAEGAIRNAKYKERPDVRARRIKGLEAAKRKSERSKAEAERFLRAWRSEKLNHAMAVAISNYDHISMCFPLADYPRNPPASQYEGQTGLWSALTDSVITFEQARELAIPVHERTIERQIRWIEHYDNRLAYERAMIGEAGGTVADRTGPEKGGACRCWSSPGYGKGWSYIQKVNKVSVTVLDMPSYGDRAYTRTVPFDKLHAVMTAAQVAEHRAAGRVIEDAKKTGFFLRDSSTDHFETHAESAERVHQEHVAAAEKPKPDPEAFSAMQATLKAGVQVATVDQLFPTPPDVAARMVELAEIEDWHAVLEPSSGTGHILAAIRGARPSAVLTHVEIDRALCISTGAINRDFLACNGDLGTFDRILMNPPFRNGEDIKHIEHAATFLKPGGRLVAICANGPRQAERLKPRATEWHELPAGTFDGTGVRTALLVIEAAT